MKLPWANRRGFVRIQASRVVVWKETFCPVILCKDKQQVWRVKQVEWRLGAASVHPLWFTCACLHTISMECMYDLCKCPGRENGLHLLRLQILWVLCALGFLMWSDKEATQYIYNQGFTRPAASLFSLELISGCACHKPDPVLLGIILTRWLSCAFLWHAWSLFGESSIATVPGVRSLALHSQCLCLSSKIWLIRISQAVVFLNQKVQH